MDQLIKRAEVLITEYKLQESKLKKLMTNIKEITKHLKQKQQELEELEHLYNEIKQQCGETDKTSELELNIATIKAIVSNDYQSLKRLLKDTKEVENKLKQTKNMMKIDLSSFNLEIDYLKLIKLIKKQKNTVILPPMGGGVFGAATGASWVLATQIVEASTIIASGTCTYVNLYVKFWTDKSP